MTLQNNNSQSSTTAPAATDQKQNDKEINFRKQEQMFQRLLAEKEEQISLMRQQIQTKTQELAAPEEDDNDDEPYVDKKKLTKTLSSFERKLEEKIEKKAEEKARHLLAEAEQQSWLKRNSDFEDVMQHAEKFASTNPELADTILQMPNNFERQKLVYNTIKSFGLHKPQEKQQSIQDVVNARQRSPYYQPSGVSTSPYSSAGGDFSPTGQKSAYDKMKQLQSQMRLG